MLSEDITLTVNECESSSTIQFDLSVFSSKDTFVGFGNNKENIYVIMISSNDTIYELKYNYYTKQINLLPNSINIISNTVNPIDKYRWVQIKRDLKGLTNDYYTFSTNNKQIPIMFGTNIESNNENDFHEAVLNLYAKPDYDLLLKRNNYHYEQWNSSECNCNHYKYYLKRSCFCDPCYTSPTVVEINNNQVIGVSYTSSDVNDRCESKINYNNYHNMDEIFTTINSAIERKPDAISIFYDDRCNYPSKFSQDISFKIADDELTYTIYGLTCLDNTI